MEANQIVAKLRKHAAELMERANTRMATLGTVAGNDESETQRSIRKAAQGDLAASCEMSQDADNIEAELQRGS